MAVAKAPILNAGGKRRFIAHREAMLRLSIGVPYAVRHG